MDRIVYCLEAVDHDQPLDRLFLPAERALTASHSPLFGGIQVIRGTALQMEDPDWHRHLYQPLPEPREVSLTAVPYYLWDNRDAGPMRVWLPLAPRTPPAGGLEQQAAVSVSFESGNAQIRGINDGLEPRNSGEQPSALCHWWPHKGTQEWVQYSWKSPVTIRGTKVYWFDDTGRGECRLPDSWTVEQLTANGWTPVRAPPVTQSPPTNGARSSSTPSPPPPCGCWSTAARIGPPVSTNGKSPRPTTPGSRRREPALKGFCNLLPTASQRERIPRLPVHSQEC